ncbi:MAG TPA: 3-dehydroquinate synthase [Flammeovirgaceae bacterium]|nr:3-dehydroquinate synthase [Flammeovirgaceae bacterium]
MSGYASYIHFTQQVKQDLQEALQTADYSALFVLVDDHTRQHCLPVIAAALPAGYQLITIRPGEEHKNPDTCRHIWTALTEAQADRQALLLNLGGGVIGDMGGFCARTYKRGIAFWNIPTTLLAQVDASVGGKLGVDLAGYKNQIGIFSEPDRVIIDPVFFKTLPHDELLSGFAEMLKHGLIADADHYRELTGIDIKQADWLSLIPRSVKIKQDIVAKDPTERGLRKLLNFGHTIGHAIESYLLLQQRPVKHGFAVAAGMVCETFLSYQKGLLPEADMLNICDYLLAMFPPLAIDNSALAAIADLARQDKKNTSTTIQAVLLQAPGQAVIDKAITAADIRQALAFYQEKIK